MKGRSKKEDIDEHNLPTEPLPYPPGAFDTTYNTLPMPEPQERPFPRQVGYDPLVPAARLQPPPVAAAYPYLPPPPAIDNRHRPAGGAGPAVGSAHRRHSLIPPLVRLCFWVIELTLLTRFVLGLLGITQGASWISLVYAGAALAEQPLRLLLQGVVRLDLVANLDLYALLACFVYWLLSRILVGFLKALLN